MIGAAFLALACLPSALEEHRRPVTAAMPDLNLPPDPIDFWRNDPHPAEVYRGVGVEHEHEGRLINQYAHQPRANAHRICRGRP